ncbi:MAG: PA14 domain-containing protein, partial [bacterium]
FLDQAGVVQAYLYSAPKKDLGPGGRLAKKYRNAGQGLLGKYQAVTGPYTQVDPILNFALRSDFPVTVVPPFRVEWTGQLMVKNPGAYQFIILTTDTGRVVLDGKTVLSAGNQKSRRIHLRAGEHPLLVDYVKCQGGVARFHLLWKTPGDNRYQVVPALAFKTNFSVKGD